MSHAVHWALCQSEEFRDEHGLLPALKEIPAQMEETDKQISSIDEPRVLVQ